MEVNEILKSIRAGDLDDDLSLILQGVRMRQRINSLNKASELRIGDRVLFTEVRPKYLVGYEAEVTGFSGESIVVKPLVAVGRFGTRPIRVKPTMIEKVGS